MAKQKDEPVLEGEIEETVYECWISDGSTGEGFCKLEPDDVPTWVEEQMTNMLLHHRLHIVQHLKSEYEDGS